MKKYKVRIKSMPDMAYGGQNGYGLDLGQTKLDNQMRKPTGYESPSDTLQPVPRSMANLEAERGETAYGDLDGDGRNEHSKIGGKRHSQGGTPLNLKPGTFIYSDTRKMGIGGDALAMFGKSKDSKKKFTPAQLAKQYELNKYKAIAEDPNADPLNKKTAEMMLANNERKLAQLALVQEGMKGFPQGIPQAAMAALPPEMAMQLQGMQEQGTEYAKKGGSTFSGNAWYQEGGTPFPTPYTNEYMDAMAKDYNTFYSDEAPEVPYARIPKNDDGFDAYYYSKKQGMPKRSIPFTGWTVKLKGAPDTDMDYIDDDGITPAPIAKKNRVVARVDNGSRLVDPDFQDLWRQVSYTQQNNRLNAYGLPFMKFMQGGSLDKYQTKGQVGKNRYNVYDSDQLTQLLDLAKKNNYDVNLPINMQDPNDQQRITLPGIQKQRGKSGIYGEENWVDPQHMADFKARHSWFTDMAPNWNPAMPGATLAFQKAYDAQRTGMGLAPYFGTGRKFRAYDDMFGEYTFSAPGITPNTAPATTTPTTPPATSPQVTAKNNNTPPAPGAPAPVPGNPGNPYAAPNTGYMSPDLLAGLQALMSRSNLPTLRPFMATPGLTKPATVFRDPTREYAATAEMANAERQAMATLGRPQNFSAAASQLAGRQIAANANTDANISGQNVMIANQAAQQNAMLDNQYMAQRAQANNLYGQMANEYTKENFRNEDAANKAILASAQNAWNNRMMLDMTNKVNPYFGVDPRSGYAMLKDPNRDLLSAIRGSRGTGAIGQQTYPEMLKYATEVLRMPADKAEAYVLEAMKAKGRTTAVDRDNDGFPDMTSYNQAMLPYFNAITNMGRMGQMR